MAENSFNMMALGEFRFSLSTAAYQDLERSSSWRWPSVERIGARPAMQYVGPGEDTVQMNGTIYPHFRGGLGQVSKMREMASRGVPLSMIDGTGRVWGRYVITEVREGLSVFFSNGKPRKVDFDLSLTLYDDNFATAAPRVLAIEAVGARPLLPDADAISTAIAALDTPLNAETWAASVTGKAMLGMPDMRKLMTFTTEGLDRFKGAIVEGAAAIGKVRETVGGVVGVAQESVNMVSNLKGSAGALIQSAGDFLSDPSISAFNSVGRNLDQVIANATTHRVVPLDAVLDELIAIAGEGKDIVEQISRDAEVQAVIRQLMAGRNG